MVWEIRESVKRAIVDMTGKQWEGIPWRRGPLKGGTVEERTSL